MTSGHRLPGRQARRLERRVAMLERRSLGFSRARVAFVILGGLLVLWSFRALDGGTGILALGLVAAGFIALVRRHDRVERGLLQTRLLHRIKELHEHRRRLEWDQLRPALVTDQIDPFAVDLNLTGDRSLHHLLDSCGTVGGSTRLKEWLIDPFPAYENIRARQRLVRDLLPRELFRDHLARVTLAGSLDSNGSPDSNSSPDTNGSPDTDGSPGTNSSSGAGVRWDDRVLRRWLERNDVVPQLKPWLIGLTTFSAVNVGLILAHVAGLLPPIWALSVLIYFAVYYTRRRAIKHLFDEAQELDLVLERLMPPLLYLEQFRFASGSQAAGVTASLRHGVPADRTEPTATNAAAESIPAGKEESTEPELESGRTPPKPAWGRNQGSTDSLTPSGSMRKVRRIAAGAAVTRSEVLWLVLNVLMPWDLLFTYLLHLAKRSIRNKMPAWLDAWYTIEAASALAGYAANHPDRTFPTIRPLDGSSPVFRGNGLGHPLIREDLKVRNDFSADRLGGIILITGSNMSGKSTFLRTLGINLRMAYAGGPVDAASLETVPFRVLTSINVVDSIQEGLSHFYAEVQRLKDLLNAFDGPLPLFILIDEIFRGTNNRERLIGSRAYVRALAGRNAVSLVSTHDLELTQLENEIDEMRNFHFREEVSNGRMTFDYKLRPGPSPSTNALKIMKAAGLPVDVDKA